MAFFHLASSWFMSKNLIAGGQNQFGSACDVFDICALDKINPSPTMFV